MIMTLRSTPTPTPTLKPTLTLTPTPTNSHGYHNVCDKAINNNRLITIDFL